MASSSLSTHEGESSKSLCDRLSLTRDPVRGSSRRITTGRFRPANIRLTNRRSDMPRLLLALSSRKAIATTKTTPQIRRDGQGRSISEIYQQLRIAN
jgi:hypothetical protein